MYAENLELLINDIESARLQYSPHLIIKLVAVSKYNTSDDIIKVYNAGQRCFGENKVQDLESKMQALKNYPLDFHFIGHLQENKINALLKLDIGLLHSLDSIKLANALQMRLKKESKTINALMQINSAKNAGQSGFMPEIAKDRFLEIKETCSNINLIGIMSMGANTDDAMLIDKGFAITKNIFDSLHKYGAEVLSMGMSNDFKIAIANGSNLLRIGSKIFH